MDTGRTRRPAGKAAGALFSTWPLSAATNRSFRNVLQPEGGPKVDFSSPRGEPALTPAGGVSWRIFSSPISLFVGGVAAVIMEFADARVAHGVWEHSDFRRDPLARMQRTGLAAMVTVYAAQSAAKSMIAHVVRQHDAVRGRAPDGEAYHANDDTLLTWVQATASYGFVTAYDRFVDQLSKGERDAAYAEAAPGARLYGVQTPPRNTREIEAVFARMEPLLQPNPVIGEFLEVIRSPRAVPAVMRPLQGRLVNAAVSILPAWLQDRLGLAEQGGLSALDRRLIAFAASSAAQISVDAHPAVQACRRLGLQDRCYLKS